MKINIQITGLKEIQTQLGAQAKQANYAASRALNTTAYAINTRLKKDMASTFKGGATAYSLRAFKVTKADKTNLTATVALRTDAPAGGTQYTKPWPTCSPAARASTKSSRAGCAPAPAASRPDRCPRRRHAPGPATATCAAPP
jgi:hypothetical protein